MPEQPDRRPTAVPTLPPFESHLIEEVRDLHADVESLRGSGWLFTRRTIERQKLRRKRVRRATRLRMDRLHSKARSGITWGAVAVALLSAATYIEPAALVSLGPWGPPVGALVASGAASAAAFLKPSTTEDLPVEIRSLIANNNFTGRPMTQDSDSTQTPTDERLAASYADVGEYLRTNYRRVFDALLDEGEMIATDEELQRMLVELINEDVDIPVVPETLERLGLTTAYDLGQAGLLTLTKAARVRFDLPDDDDIPSGDEAASGAGAEG